MEETTKEMGLITNLVYGFSDKGVGTHLEIKLLRGVTTLFLTQEETTNLLTELKLSNVMALKLNTCAVSVDQNQKVTFEGIV